MTKILVSIPGPIFLLFYWGAWIGLYVWTSRRIESGERGRAGAGLALDPASLKPVELALLARGWTGPLHCVVYELLHRHALLWCEEDQASLVADPAAVGQDELESLILRAAATPTHPERLLWKIEGPSRALLERQVRSLESKGLLVHRDDVRGGMTAALLPGAIITWLGLMKLWMGIQRGRPVTLLVISLLFAPLVFLFLRKRWGNLCLTQAGRKLLARTRQHLQWLKLAPSREDESGHAQTMMALGILGVAALSVDPLAAGLESAWRPAAGLGGGADSGNSGGGGWSGDSSGGSDGSGGDSGGSDGGGGGCGGCGGGGD